MSEPELRGLEPHRPLGFAENGRTNRPSPLQVGLAYEWDNMPVGLRTACRRHKNPILRRRRTRIVGASVAELRQSETAELLDLSEPAKHLAFFPNGQVSGLNNRGDGTIRMLGLDRAELAQSRADAFGETVSRRLTGRKRCVSPKRVPECVGAARLRRRLASWCGTLSHSSERLRRSTFRLSTFQHCSLVSPAWRTRKRQSAPGRTQRGRFRGERAGNRSVASRRWRAAPSTATEDMPATRAPIASVSVQNFKALKDITFKLPETVGVIRRSTVHDHPRRERHRQEFRAQSGYPRSVGYARNL